MAGDLYQLGNGNEDTLSVSNFRPDGLLCISIYDEDDDTLNQKLMTFKQFDEMVAAVEKARREAKDGE